MSALPRVLATLVGFGLWVLLITVTRQWSVEGSGWATVNAVIVGVFGLAALTPVLLWLWRR